MQLSATKTEYLKVDVDESDIFAAMEQIIRSRSGLGLDQWVNPEGDLMETQEAYHGSDWDEKKGKATELQKLGYQTIRNMRDIFYKRTSK